MASRPKYFFETFTAEAASFDSKFSDYVNKKYDDGWEYEDCQYWSEGDWRSAYCLFERE